MEILNRKGIKQQAREFIGTNRKWFSMFLALLPISLIQAIANGGLTIIRTFTENSEQASTDVEYSSGGSGLITWLLLPFTVGIAGYFLNHLRGMNPDWKSLYKEGIDNYGKYFVVSFVTNLSIALWSLLFIIPGIVKSFQYYFVHHIIHDNPNLTGKQARDLSKRMTDGFKGDLFVFGLSFIPWGILSVVTLGIANIYVLPYVNCATAMYYENLKHNAITKGIATAEEFGYIPLAEAPVEVTVEQ